MLAFLKAVLATAQAEKKPDETENAPKPPAVNLDDPVVDNSVIMSDPDDSAGKLQAYWSNILENMPDLSDETTLNKYKQRLDMDLSRQMSLMVQSIKTKSSHEAAIHLHVVLAHNYAKYLEASPLTLNGYLPASPVPERIACLPDQSQPVSSSRLVRFCSIH